MRSIEISLPRIQEVDFIPDVGGQTQTKKVLQGKTMEVAVPAENGTLKLPFLGEVSVRVSENPPLVEVEGDGIGKMSEPIMQHPDEKQATRRYQASGQTENGIQVTVVTPEVHTWESKNEIPVFEPRKDGPAPTTRPTNF